MAISALNQKVYFDDIINRVHRWTKCTEKRGNHGQVIKL